MTYCTECRLFLASDAVHCPLCGSEAGTIPADVTRPQFDASSSGCPERVSPAGVKTAMFGIPVTDTTISATPEPDSSTAYSRIKSSRLTAAERRILAFELLSVTFGIALLMTLVFDILITRQITWSRFTTISLLTLYLCAGMPLVLWGHPWLIYAVLGPATGAAVLVWALVSDGFQWFLALGLPLVALFQACVLACLVLVLIQKRRGLNVVAIVLATVALICAGVELLVSHFLTGNFNLSWSLVVLVSMVPPAGLFFYLHYRIMDRASLRKLFRL